MIHHVWTVLCSNSVVDRESNNVSLQNVIEQLNIHGEPEPDGVVPDRFEVVTLWARADFDVPSRGRARLSFLAPSGPLADPIEYDVNLSSANRYRQISRLQGLPVREPGRHTFRVELQSQDETTWHQVAAVPLEIVFEPGETEAAGE